MLHDMMASDRMAEYRREAEGRRLANELPTATRARHRFHLHLPAVLRHPVRTSSRTA
ncbi:MAG: hypothetical protein U0869_00545 [Chloroflexota bacterium]